MIPAPFSPFIGRQPGQPKIIAPVSTFRFVPKDAPAPEVAIDSPEKHGFPLDKHWVDWAQPGTVVVIEQPAGQSCAALGGIMAARLKYLGVKAAVVDGRVRDLAELHGAGLHVCSADTYLMHMYLHGNDMLMFLLLYRSGHEEHPPSAPAQKPNPENATYPSPSEESPSPL